MFHTPRLAARLPIVSNLLIAGLKFGVGIAIGSVAVLSDGLDSAFDLVAAIIGLVSIQAAERPPDPEHQFGHGKMENASAVVEGALITLGVGFILYRAVHRLQTGGEVATAEVGIAAMVVSLAVNIGVSWHLGKVAERHGSVALKAAASHRLSDVFTSLAVLIGLVLVKVTDRQVIDPIVAIIVAALVLRMAVFDLVWPSGQVLLDVSLPPKQQEAVLAVLQAHHDRYVTYQHLRTRSAGRHRYVSLTLLVPPQMSVLEAHDVCDLLERDIRNRLPDTTVTIHVEPGDHAATPRERAR